MYVVDMLLPMGGWVLGAGYSCVVISFICMGMLHMGEHVCGCDFWDALCVVDLGCVVKFVGRFVQGEMRRCNDLGASRECIGICRVLV